MKESSTDEQLRKNISELEKTLEALRESESLKTVGEMLQKGSVSIILVILYLGWIINFKGERYKSCIESGGNYW